MESHKKRTDIVLESEVKQYVVANNYAAFIHILKTSRNDPMFEHSYNPIIQSVFGYVLEIETERNIFSTACLSYGASINMATEEGDYPIHYAARSCNVKTLKNVLSHPAVNVDQMTKNGLTALELLCDRITNDNCKDVAKCILQLLKNKATIPTSISQAMQENYQGIYSTLFDETQRQKIGPNIENKFVLVDVFLKYLRDNSIDDVSISQVPMLLKWAIKTKNDNAAKQLIEHYKTWYYKEKLSADCMIDPLEEILPKSILTCCCKVGNYTVLEYLFQNSTEDELKHLLQKRLYGRFVEGNLLVLLVHNIDENNPDCRFFKCLRLCLNISLIDVDEVDGRGRRALDYAAIYKLKRVQKLLLEKGAYIGGRDKFGESVICKIDPHVLKQHFDSCIYSIDKADQYQMEKYNIAVNWNNLIPPTYKTDKWSRNRNNQEAADCSNSKNKKKWEESVIPAIVEFTNITKISKSSDTDREVRLGLIEHPVITTMLNIRDPEPGWRTYLLRLVRSVPFFLLFFFAIDSEFVSYALILLTIYEMLSNCCDALRIVFKLIFKQFTSFIRKGVPKLLTNMLFYQFVFTLVMILAKAFSNDELLITSTSIMVGLSMRRFMTSYNCFDKYMYMLDIVTVRMIKYLSVYSWILVTYAQYMYFINQSRESTLQNHDKNDTTIQTTHSTKWGNITLKSETLLATFLKTLVMYIGEYEAGEMQFQLYSYLMFVLFMIITITLSNLLIAFVFSDVLAIFKESSRLKIVLKTKRVLSREYPVASWLREKWNKIDKQPQCNNCYHDVENIQIVIKPVNDHKAINNEITLYKKSKELVKFSFCSTEFARTLINATSIQDNRTVAA